MAIYVDDIIIIESDTLEIYHLKTHLDTTFSIKDLGQLSYFLGIEVTHLSDALYKSLVGKLNFLTYTKPDLAFAVQTLNQYVASTIGQTILLRATNSLSLIAYSDSDWASCSSTRHFVTGYIVLLVGSPISWKSKKQGTVSKSSSKAKYKAQSSAASKITWVVRLLEELGLSNLKLVSLHCDNQSFIHIAKNPVHHEHKTKHIEIDVHFTKDKVLKGLLELNYHPTHQQLADVFPKAISRP
ncbi:uncharacterized protein LOC110711903 [Chenopodium quinoa]|uniref:uncharacterized protein LOC110711903 n=1 Tax=Chenopodium quinoa TaxID=63459 RepID=UPI000B799B3E|nr:uncharacterized protein LOC110711903 [Chenopodium quinoa]